MIRMFICDYCFRAPEDCHLMTYKKPIVTDKLPCY